MKTLFNVTHLLESREIKLELRRGDRIQVQKGIVKFIALPLPFSRQLKIWSFHLVVGRERQRSLLKGVTLGRAD